MAECAFCREPLAPGPPWAPGEGHRLAFDPEKGRLWAVCPSCKRWNLTPLEDRWETLESCERAVHDRGRERLKTPHLSLLDVGEGELIRVGKPPRTEFVDWRYGPRLPSGGKVGGFLSRVLSALPPPPPAGYDPYKRIFSLEDESPWFASPFLESASALRYLFSQVPLAPSCPGCRRPLALKPWDFQTLRVTAGATGFEVLAPCGFCRELVAADLALVRPTLRLALGLVTPSGVLRGVAAEAAQVLGPQEGGEELLRDLAREGSTLGELTLQRRGALIIALDERAEAQALEDEWRAAEEIAAIADGELSSVPGFEEFRRRTLEEGE